VGFLALVITLVLEQVRPLPARHAFATTMETVADVAESNLNAGHKRHGVYAWILVVLGAAIVCGILYAILGRISFFLSIALNVCVLYLTLGFRQFSHPFTEIQIALSQGDLDTARRILTAWKRVEDVAYDAGDLTVEEVVRQAMERGVLLAHRHVFGVFFWFVVLPGPMGPVLYRLSEFLARRWNRPPAAGVPMDHFGNFAVTAFAWIDWLPVRLSALGFAVVGDFEGAVYCWRQVAKNAEAARAEVVRGDTREDSAPVLLAAASGALGTRLMSTADAVRWFDEPGHEGAGLAEPDGSRLRSP
jgi:adenosylcobinamide-phosphate synthase